MTDAGSQQEEVEPTEPPVVLQTEQITKGLSRIQRTHDGSSYAFVELSLEEQDPPLEELAQELQPYEHLQHLNLSKNAIKDISTIAYLNHLLTVNANNNAVGGIKFLEELATSDRLQFLQRLDLSNNKVKELTVIPQPRLSWLNLSVNQITTCADFSGHGELVTLLLSENQLTNCAGLVSMAKLQELNLSANQVTSLSDLRGLPALKKLDASKNKLENLDNFPELPALEHFDASENAIEANGDKAVAQLGKCRALKTIIMNGNPWVDEKGDDFKKEVLIALDNLKIKQVNDMEEVTEEDRTEAKAEKRARIEAEEEARKAAEEAAAAGEKPEGEE